MSNHKPEAHGGPVPERDPILVPKRVEHDDTMGRSRTPFVVVAACFMFLCLGIMFTAVWAAMSVPRIGDPQYKFEFKQMADIAHALRDVAGDVEGGRQRAKFDVPDTRGREFYETALRQGALEPEIASKLVSVSTTTDLPPDHDWITDPEGELPEGACSYTAPRADRLAELWGRTGCERCVMVCFNARNWDNYGDRGVLVLWSDEHKGEFLTFEEAHKDWGITREEWDNPAEKLFGKKAPFQHTYE